MSEYNIFTVVPAVDPYNGRALGTYSIMGHCSHLSAGAQYVTYKRAEDAQA